MAANVLSNFHTHAHTHSKPEFHFRCASIWTTTTRRRTGNKECGEVHQSKQKSFNARGWTHVQIDWWICIAVCLGYSGTIKFYHTTIYEQIKSDTCLLHLTFSSCLVLSMMRCFLILYAYSKRYFKQTKCTASKCSRKCKQKFNFGTKNVVHLLISFISLISLFQSHFHCVHFGRPQFDELFSWLDYYYVVWSMYKRWRRWQRQRWISCDQFAVVVVFVVVCIVDIVRMCDCACHLIVCNYNVVDSISNQQIELYERSRHQKYVVECIFVIWLMALSIWIEQRYPISPWNVKVSREANAGFCVLFFFYFLHLLSTGDKEKSEMQLKCFPLCTNDDWTFVSRPTDVCEISSFEANARTNLKIACTYVPQR